MQRIPVTSSNVVSIGYEAKHMTLEIEFNNGSVYQYFDVPEFEFQSLMQADSHGKYFNANIRDHYRFVRI